MSLNNQPMKIQIEITELLKLYNPATMQMQYAITFTLNGESLSDNTAISRLSPKLTPNEEASDAQQAFREIFKKIGDRIFNTQPTAPAFVDAHTKFLMQEQFKNCEFKP